MKVRELMSDRVITVGSKEPVAAASRLMKRFNLGALPVTDDDGKLKGMLTDRDIVLRCVASGLDVKSVSVGEVMSRSVLTAAPGDELELAARSMGGSQVRRLPVVEGGHVVGMLSLADMARVGSMEAASALADISSNLRRRTEMSTEKARLGAIENGAAVRPDNNA